MPKINTNYIREGLSKSSEVAEKLSTLTYEKLLPIGYIHPSKNNIFNSKDDENTYKDLASSIEMSGLIHPIAVRKVDQLNYDILSGERRYQAITRFLDWKTIPCTVFEGLSDTQAQLKLLAANLDVREYEPAEKLKFFESYYDLLSKMKADGEFKGGIQKSIAEVLGVSTRQIRKYQTILGNVSKDEKQAILSGEKGVEEAYQEIVSNTHPTEEKEEEIDKFTEEEKEQQVHESIEREKQGKDFEKCIITDDTFSDELSLTSSKEDLESISYSKTKSEARYVESDDIMYAIKQYYNCTKLYKYYLTNMPTPKEAHQALINPEYAIDSPMINISNEFSISFIGQGFMIHKGDCQSIISISDVDSKIRKLIRSKELLDSKSLRIIFSNLASQEV